MSPKPIFLVGFMATGKSTVGKLVAERLRRPFVDLDELIADAAGASVADIFRNEGEAGFRRRESDAVRAACREKNVVVATGGGAACREENLWMMLEAGRVVALSAAPAEIVRRASCAPARPLLEGETAQELIAGSLLRQREPFYARAHQRVDTDGKIPAEVADEVVRALERES